MILRRDFLQLLAVSAGAFALPDSISSVEAARGMIYDPKRFGNASLFHIGDIHGQIFPHYFRETATRMGVGEDLNQFSYLAGEGYLEYFRIMPGTLYSYALTHLNFEGESSFFGRAGGIANLAGLLNRLRANRPASLLLDSGDTWFGSGLSSRMRGQDMARISGLLGVDAMTGDWDFAHGAVRMAELLSQDSLERMSFLAHNIQGRDGAEVPFRPYSVYFLNGFPVGVIGQAYSHIGKMGGRNFVPEWTFGVDEARLQVMVDLVRAQGARLVVLLSHAGLATDNKLARRVRGIDVVLSGHSHDAFPVPMVINGGSNQTLIVSAGGGGRFLGVLDLDLRNGKMHGYRYHLLPLFEKLLTPDPEVASAITLMRKPHARELDEVLAKTEGMLYGRDNFVGSFDRLILDILRVARNADIAIGPGRRWGPTLLAGANITMDDVLAHTAAGQSGYFEEKLSGKEIHRRLEVWCDEVFNPDPYLRSGDDMVRVEGLGFLCDPGAQLGSRIRDLVVGDRPLKEDAYYDVVSWGVSSPVQPGDEPVWWVVADALRRMKTVPTINLQAPVIKGAKGNKGLG